ncbi:hypothetical protein GCM10027614_48510 [Micromonospora vulcania]
MVAGRLGVLLTRADEETEEGLSLVREAADVLDRLGDARQRAAGHDRVALALLHRERWADALDALDRVPADAGGDRYLATRIALHRAHLLGQLDRVDEALAAADEARRLGRELGVGELVTAACLAYAGMVDEPADAVAACDEALLVAPVDGELPVRVARARALLAAGRSAEAVDDFVEAVTLCVERGAEGTPSCVGSWRTRTGWWAGSPRRPRSLRRRSSGWTGSAHRPRRTAVATCWPASTPRSARSTRRSRCWSSWPAIWTDRTTSHTGRRCWRRPAGSSTTPTGTRWPASGSRRLRPRTGSPTCHSTSCGPDGGRRTPGSGPTTGRRLCTPSSRWTGWRRRWPGSRSSRRR